MEYYSLTMPNLLGPKAETLLKNHNTNLVGGSVDNLLIPKSIQTTSSTTISDKILDIVSSVYNNYIKDNILFILFAIFVVVFLSFRYYNKKEADKMKQEKEYVKEPMQDKLPVQNQSQDIKIYTEPITQFEPFDSHNNFSNF